MPALSPRPARLLCFALAVLVNLAATSSTIMAETLPPPAFETAIESLRADQQERADFTWLITCAGLVLLMQIGFLMLEAGAARSKNSINVAQKNLCDLLISVTVFTLLGFSLMFGSSQMGLLGWDKQHLIIGFQDPWLYAFFAFQAMFVGTAATIVSGAVAERMKLKAYALITLMIGVFIYPVFGHWAWGNLLDPSNTAWLADLGFMDFAGSTVVHATGAWVALIAIWMLGPRRDRYDAQGKPQRMHGHSMVLTTAGAVVLFVGWIGFNGGSSLRASADIGQIIINTILSGTMGGAVAMVFGRYRDGIFLPTRSVSGLLGGLVAVTAGANVIAPIGAIATGFLAGLLVVWSEDFLEKRLKLDDVVGAVSVHGTCGIFGTLAVAFFAIDSMLVAETRLEQVLAQATGIAINALWVSAIAVPGIWLIKRFVGMRVTDLEEAAGLNVAEHGASLGTHALQASLQAITEGRADLATRLDETTGDEAADLAVILNPFLSKVQVLVGDMSETSGRLAAELHSVADNVSRSATVVSAHTQEVQVSAQTVASSADGALDDAKGLRRKSTHLAQAAGTVSQDVRQIAAYIENLSSAVMTVSSDAERASQVSNEAMTLSQTASHTVSQLGEAADEIETVVDLIIGIQNQTSLLALNASIEAARAGQHGDGFAVVANEIKALSERTARATEDIRNAILKVRDSSLGSRDMIGEVGTILQSIAGAVSDIHTTAAREQDNVATIAGGVGDASQRIETLSQGVANLETETMAVEKAVHHASSHAKAANDAVHALRAQADISLETSRAVSASSHEMEGVAVGLSHRAGVLKS
ncbi:MAG: ammonium transporter [Devosiaceae bacterium]